MRIGGLSSYIHLRRRLTSPPHKWAEHPAYSIRFLEGRKAFKESTMLKWAVIFAVIALIAGVMGFTGIAAGAAGIAKVLFVLFAIGFVIFLALAVMGAKALRR